MRSTRRILLAVAASIFVFSAVPAFGASYLGTVDFADTATGYLGGWYGSNPRSGFMSVTNDGGDTWHAILTGQSSPIGVGLGGSSIARAVSQGDDMVLSTEDSGATWVRNTPVVGTGASFSDIAKSSTGYVAVGTDLATADGDVGVIYTSANGVSGWTERFRGPIYPGAIVNGDYVPGPATYARMDKVAFSPDGLTGYAIGSEWNLPTYNNANDFKGLLISKTVNGGSTWTTPTAIAGLSANPMNDIVVTDATHAYAIGVGRMVVQTVDGTTWSAVTQSPTPNPRPAVLYGIDSFGTSLIAAVGRTNVGTVSIQSSTNGGATWSFTAGAVAGTLRSVSMITATTWIAVGDGETIGRTNDGGATWTWTTATPPKVSLTSPVAYDSASPTTRIVAGTASDVGAGVGAVDVSVLRDDGKYWNPAIGWVATPFWNPASTVNGWDSWSWSWAPDLSQVGAHSYAVSARATDAVGQSTTSVGAIRPITRIAGIDRYGTAAALARKGWDPTGTGAWMGVTDIVIANGEPGKEPDPLTAAGLAGAYNAPVLTVQATKLPTATKDTITEIALKNPKVKIHLVGGVKVVPDARWNEIRQIPGVSPDKDRVAGADRYATSAAIADRIVSHVGTAAIQGFILIAGDNPAAFYDALAASPVAYAKTMPMLSVMKGSIPTSVNDVLTSPVLKDKPRYAASSETYIGTKPAAGATRLTTSSNRYTAATDIAVYATAPARSWTSFQNTALAPTLPDALTGGAFLGKVGGVMLFTDSSSTIQSTSKAFISGNKFSIGDGWVLGGTSVVPITQETSFRKLLNP